MFTLELDFTEFDRFAAQLGRAVDQVPFALSKTLNDAAFKVRQVWVDETWPRAVTVRNTAFMNAMLHVDRATKGNYKVRIFDRLGRDYVQRLATGGMRAPKMAKHIAIPAKGWVQWGPRGKPKRQQIRNLIAATPAKALRITDRGLWVGEAGRLKLRYTFKATVMQQKMALFYEDFEYVFRNELRTGFADNLWQAVLSRRRR